MVARRRGLTLLEVAISAVVLSLILAVLLGTTDSTLRVSSTSASVGEAQLKAETALRLIERELMLGGPVGSNGAITITGVPTAPIITYTPQSSGAWTYDKNDPTAAPWGAQRRQIRFEHSEDTVDTNDNDNDFLFDEGEIVMYEEVASAWVNPVVIARDVKTFTAVLTAPGTPGTYPQLELAVELERVLFKAVKSSADVTALGAGNGPRTSHTARSTLSLMN